MPPCEKGRKGEEASNINDQFQNDFLIVPNPATDNFTILWQPFVGTDVIKARIYDMHFQLIKTVEMANNLGEYRFVSSQYTAGVYLVVLETANNRISKPLIITQP